MRPESSAPTSWASQILSNSVFDIFSLLTASQARGDDCEKRGLRGRGVLKMVWQVSVECHAIALAQLVALPVANERERALLDERRLTTSRLVHRRVVLGTGRATWGERVT